MGFLLYSFGGVWCIFSISKESKIELFELQLKGQSHEKVSELRVWRGILGPN
jgi:hypothetical protein